jgi:hypothetical protein
MTSRPFEHIVAAMIPSRTAAKNMPVSFSQMSTTLPFLYQTRTLTNFAWKRSNAAYQSSRCISRNLSGSSRFQHLVKRGTIPTTTSAPKTETEGGLSIKRKTNMSGMDPPSAGSWDFDPKEGSFQKAFKIKKHFTKPYEPGKKEILEEDDFTPPEAIHFDEGLDSDLWGEDEIQQLTDSHQSRGSTITARERRAFQKIFSDIFESSLRPSAKKEDWFNDDDLEDSRPENKQRAKSKLDNILTSSIRRESLSNREGIEAAVERYPPALQAAAARAMGLANNEEDEGAALVEGTQLDEQQLEALREPECTRVEGLMKNAKTDLELWDVMEKEVFPLIAKLGLEDASSSESAVVPKGVESKKKREKKTNTEEVPEEVQQPELNQLMKAEHEVSPLSIYGPLYPSYLLLGLRLLDRGFAKPSPLALALLPRIKSFGFISHVLGASTQFYNELLRIYHYRQDDFRGMLDLLTEMEDSALDVDDETLGIVLDVIKAQRFIQLGAKGSAIKALWRMPEFAHHRFIDWRDSIHRAIYERTEVRH